MEVQIQCLKSSHYFTYLNEQIRHLWVSFYLYLTAEMAKWLVLLRSFLLV